MDVSWPLLAQSDVISSAASRAYRSDSGEESYSSVIRAALLAKCFL